MGREPVGKGQPRMDKENALSLAHLLHCHGSPTRKRRSHHPRLPTLLSAASFLRPSLQENFSKCLSVLATPTSRLRACPLLHLCTSGFCSPGFPPPRGQFSVFVLFGYLQHLTWWSLFLFRNFFHLAFSAPQLFPLCLTWAPLLRSLSWFPPVSL